MTEWEFDKLYAVAERMAKPFDESGEDYPPELVRLIKALAKADVPESSPRPVVVPRTVRRRFLTQIRQYLATPGEQP
jgi:hypothetical protein